MMGSRINHGCEPNVSIIWKKGALAITALKNISKGEEILREYYSPADGKVSKSFRMRNCKCPACPETSASNDDTEDIDTEYNDTKDEDSEDEDDPETSTWPNLH